MTVRVLFFAQLRERAGGRGETLLEVPADAGVDAVLARLEADGLLDAALAAKVAVAVNREYVARTHRLCDGDEVAVLPPVSGGFR